MQLLLVGKDKPLERLDDIEQLPEQGWLWIDALVSEPGEPWRELAEKLTGVHIFDAHMTDVANETHPSYFDNTSDYEVVIFRGLSAQIELSDDKTVHLPKGTDYHFGPINTQPYRIKSAPITFLLFPRLLITVRPEEAPAIGAVRVADEQRDAHPGATGRADLSRAQRHGGSLPRTTPAVDRQAGSVAAQSARPTPPV